MISYIFFSLQSRYFKVRTDAVASIVVYVVPLRTMASLLDFSPKSAKLDFWILKKKKIGLHYS